MTMMGRRAIQVVAVARTKSGSRECKQLKPLPFRRREREEKKRKDKNDDFVAASSLSYAPRHILGLHTYSFAPSKKRETTVLPCSWFTSPTYANTPSPTFFAATAHCPLVVVPMPGMSPSN